MILTRAFPGNGLEVYLLVALLLDREMFPGLKFPHLYVVGVEVKWGKRGSRERQTTVDVSIGCETERKEVGK